MPLLNGAFRSEAYQTQGLSLDQMRHFVSNQIYAARAWSAHHDYPDKRIGLAEIRHFAPGRQGDGRVQCHGRPLGR